MKLTSYGNETPASPLQKKTRLGYEEIWKLFANASFFPRTSPKATLIHRQLVVRSWGRECETRYVRPRTQHQSDALPETRSKGGASGRGGSNAEEVRAHKETKLHRF